jgi:hypothetical protein
MAWAPDYVTVAELRAYVTRHTDAVDDVQHALAVTAASRAVDRHCNRQFGLVASAEERLYTPVWDRHRCRWIVDIDDLMTTDNLVVEVGGTAVTEFTLEPRNAAANGRPWTRLVFDADSPTKPSGVEYQVAATAEWGWDSVPTPVEQATLLQASRFNFRRDSPAGVAGSPDQGSELRLLARVDPDVAVVLGSFIRWWGAV